MISFESVFERFIAACSDGFGDGRADENVVKSGGASCVVAMLGFPCRCCMMSMRPQAIAIFTIPLDSLSSVSLKSPNRIIFSLFLWHSLIIFVRST